MEYISYGDNNFVVVVILTHYARKIMHNKMDHIYFDT